LKNTTTENLDKKILGPLFFEEAVVGGGGGLVKGKLMPEDGGVVFNLKMSEFVEEDVTKKIEWEENDLPIEIKVAPGRTRTETGGLVFDRNFLVVKTKLSF
jgi:hypothetical protein